MIKILDAVSIAPEKLTKYLLTKRPRNDKSKWLASAGYTLDNWRVLEKNIREQILSMEASPKEITDYGQLYEIRGNIKGPAGKTLAVVTILMNELETGKTKFITMYPDRKRNS